MRLSPFGPAKDTFLEWTTNQLWNKCSGEVNAIKHFKRRQGVSKLLMGSVHTHKPTLSVKWGSRGQPCEAV